MSRSCRTLLHAIASLVALAHPGWTEETALPGSPSIAEIANGLRSQQFDARTHARGWLYFLGIDQLQALSDDVEKHGGDSEARATIQRLRLFRGDQSLIRTWATASIGQSFDVMAVVPAQQTAAELAPLCEAVAGEIEARIAHGEKIRRGYWTALAEVSTDVHLIRATLAAMQSNPSELQLRLNADLCAKQVQGQLAHADLEQGLAVLGCLAPGWEQGPDASFKILASNRDARVRDAFARTLAGSSSPAALTAAVGLLRDADAQVRSSAMAALDTFRPQPQLACITPLAADRTLDPGVRAWVWRYFTEHKAPLPDAAKSLVLDAQASLHERLALADCLVSSGAVAWLLKHEAELDPMVLAEALGCMSAAADDAVLAAADRFVATKPPALAVRVLNTFARGDARALGWVVSQLRDKRSELRTAALTALEQSAGGSIVVVSADRRHPGRDDAGAALASAWKTWYDRFRSPLDPARASALEQERALLAAAPTDRPSTTSAEEPTWALLRLCADANLGVAALRRLALHPDPSITALLIDLQDDPGFSGRLDGLLDALRPRPHAAEDIAALNARLDSEQDGVALRVLIAWRIDAAASALCERAMRSPYFVDVRDELIAWKHPAIALAARQHVQDADAEVRHRAIDLMAALATPEDVRLLSAQLAKPGEADAAVHGLLALALQDIGPAQEALAAGLAPRNPTLAKAILRAIVDQSTGTEDASGQLPGSLVDAARGCCVRGVDPELAAIAMVVLAAAADAQGLARLRSLLVHADAAWTGIVADGLAQIRTPAAAPYARAILASHILDEHAAGELIASLARGGALTSEEAKRLRAQYKQSTENAVDVAVQPVDGMVFTLELPKEPIVLKAGKLTFPVVMSNTGSTPISILTACGSATLIFADRTELTGSIDSPGPAGGPNHNLLKIPPRGKAKAVLTVTIYNAWAPADLNVRMRLEVHPSIYLADGPTSGVFHGQWMTIGFITPLLQAVERRYP